MIVFKKTTSGNVLITRTGLNPILISEPVSIEYSGEDVIILRADRPDFAFNYAEAVDKDGNAIGATLALTIENLGTSFFSRGGNGSTSSVTADQVTSTANHRVITTDEGVAINVHGLSEKATPILSTDEVKIWDSFASALKKITLASLVAYILSLIRSIFSTQATRVTFSNVNYTITANTAVFVSQIGTLSASRTVTLPAANAFKVGDIITVLDQSGTCGAVNTIVISRAGTDTIDGSTSQIIAAPYGWRRFITDGVSNWSFDGGVLRSSNNLSDLTSASTARTNLGLSAAATLPINDVGVPADGCLLFGNGTDIVQKSLHDSQILLGIYPLTYFSSTASKVITDQNENTMFPTGVGSTTIQVTDTPIIVGSKMKLRLSGFISSAANAGNSTMKIKVGGLTVITSVLALSNNLSNVPFDIDLVLTFRTVGASATVIGNGISQIYNGANGVLVRPLAMTAVSSAFSTLAPIVVDTTLQFVNTGNSITVTNATITIER